ncbi:MAG: type II toxin-antitoxin system HicB family antitoxin [Armatimonadetes bacterium]|nr:type II toxin-antitoxin system HicB family antitoxin [Anaerolineae bacterium]
MTPPAKSLAYYLELRYRIVLIPDPDGWAAILPELPGCVAAGDTIAEALALLDDAKQGWFISCLQHGDPIPEPQTALEVA